MSEPDPLDATTPPTSRPPVARSLLHHARALVDEPHAAMTGRWPRAAALLTRQALESGIAARCTELDPAIANCDARAQLLCLPLVVDADLAGDVAHTWSALSHACHHHPYDLSPTVSELAGWMGTVERLLAAP